MEENRVRQVAAAFFAARGICIDLSEADALRAAESWTEGLADDLPYSANFSVLFPHKALVYQSGSGMTIVRLFPKNGKWDYLEVFSVSCEDNCLHIEELMEELQSLGVNPNDLRGWGGEADMTPRKLCILRMWA